LLFSSALATLAGVVASWSVAGRVDPWGDTHDEYLTTTTVDGFTLPLYRFRPADAVRKVPVILCHGLGANRYNMMAAGGANLASWLARKGYDVFVVELRGAGRTVELNDMGTGGKAWEFDFDTYVSRDAPALLQKVAAVTGSDEVDWVGHSMGGMLAYALAGEPNLPGSVRLRRAVSVAGPASLEGMPARSAMLLKRGTQLPFARLPNEWMIALTQPLFPWIFPENDPALGFKANYDPVFVRGMMKYGTTSIARQLVRQFDYWYTGGTLTSMDGATDYLARLQGSRTAMLFLAGSKDIMTTKDSLRLAFDRHGGEKKLVYVGREEGQSVDYGHGDVILGARAADEVYPFIADWLASDAGGGSDQK
jgi:pimeloyl-ACP methyl ester carboxylesterase